MGAWLLRPGPGYWSLCFGPDIGKRKGKKAKTPTKLVAVMERRKGKIIKFSAASTHKLCGRRVVDYLGALRALFDRPEVRTLCVAMDASRSRIANSGKSSTTTANRPPPHPGVPTDRSAKCPTLQKVTALISYWS